MPNALPLLILGGAGLLLLSGKKKKDMPLVDSGKELPDVTGGDAVSDDTSSGSTQIPTAEPMPGPGIPAPDKPKRPLGPSGAGSCANDIYRRDAVYIDTKVASRLSQGALTAYDESGYYFYIRNDAQDKIFDDAMATFAAMASNKSAPTLRSVVLREILNGFTNNFTGKDCDWDVSTDKFDDVMKLVWDDGVRLLTLAQMMTGYTDPHPDFLFKTGKRYTMPRGPLGIPDWVYSPKINQRVMILATDKSLQNAEHLIGRVHKLSGPNGESDRFEIRIVDNFNGKDVRPKLTDKHGFKELSNAFFNKMAPTGLYRIYAEGTV